MKSYIEIEGNTTEELKEIAEFCALSSIEQLKQPDCFEITIKFVSEKEIQKINKLYRNIDKVTDVLSFPSLNIKANEKFSISNADEFSVKTERGLYYLGDIAICTKRLREQAKGYEVSVESELKKLVIHSILHLFGYDHIKDEDFEIMNQKEIELDKKINLRS